MARMPVEFEQIPTVQTALKDYPILLDSRNKDHVKVFKKLIEWSMTQGRWAGWVAEES